MARFLDRHHYCGRRSARELLDRLRGAADGSAAALESEARRQIVLALVAALEPIVARIAELTSEIRAALIDHADGRSFRSLFIDAKTAVCPATILAEMGDCREAPRPSPRSPTTAVSPRSPSNRANPSAPASDGRAITGSQTRSPPWPTRRQHNPWAADIYTRARRRGCSHQHAIRILSRAGCGVIWRLWHDHDVYDPARHAALGQLLAARSQHRKSHAARRGDLRVLPPAAPQGALCILAGDFNATLDHAEMRRLLDTGYVDAAAEVGAGHRGTWPHGRRFPPPVTIDHVLADTRIGVRKFSVGTIPDTHHGAVLATLVLQRRG